MTITLRDFTSQIKDVARPNRFILTFDNPDFGDLMFNVSKASIPKKDITGPVLKYRGTSLILAGDYKHDPLGVTFINDRDWKARKFIENWLEDIVKFETQSGGTIFNKRRLVKDYRFQHSATLTQLGRHKNDKLAVYKFANIVPMDISEIELDMSGENTIEEFTVSFQYSFWERLSTVSDGSSESNTVNLRFMTEDEIRNFLGL